MIRTSTQLKAKVRNLSEGDNNRARVLIRNYVMERFLERISLSKYKDNFILKGGMLVSSMVGLETRATMDIDTTINAFNLDAVNARKILDEIISIPIDDGIRLLLALDSISSALYTIIYVEAEDIREKVDLKKLNAGNTEIVAH